jgi:hypothetical protein
MVKTMHDMELRQEAFAPQGLDLQDIWGPEGAGAGALLSYPSSATRSFLFFFPFFLLSFFLFLVSPLADPTP